MRRDPQDRSRRPWVASVFLAAALAACATAKTPAPRVDLDPARQAVEAARQAGAPEKAETVFTRAIGHLTEAESLVVSPAGKGDVERSRQAEGLARLALTEAQCAESMARLSGSPRRTQPAAAAAAAAPPGALPASDAEKLRARLRRSEEEERRLAERVALLQRDLELTETEVIRTKAKLKGVETKAEASSAIAEARILLRRLSDDKGRSQNSARCKELLDRAEQQLRDENFGAAAFFASKAQELLETSRRGGPGPQEADRPAPRTTYVAKPSGANLRRGPALSEPVVGKVPGGASVEASAIRGDWLKVRLGELVGWAYLPLFE